MDVGEAIGARRAYRSLVPCEISDKTMEELAQCARLSPSCYNMQPWNYVFVRDEAAREALSGALLDGNEWARKASLIIAVFSKPDADCQIKDGREYFLFDCGMSVAMILLRATELGLVAHPIAGFRSGMAKKVLGIPEEMTLITLVMVGAKDAEISSLLSEEQVKSEKGRPPRKELSEFMHIDHYGAKETR